jgi:hypothetical protein
MDRVLSDMAWFRQPLILLGTVSMLGAVCHIRIVEELRPSGQVKDDDLARVSPLLRAHVIPNGSYDLSIR